MSVDRIVRWYCREKHSALQSSRFLSQTPEVVISSACTCHLEDGITIWGIPIEAAIFLTGFAAVFVGIMGLIFSTFRALESFQTQVCQRVVRCLSRPLRLHV